MGTAGPVQQVDVCFAALAAAFTLAGTDHAAGQVDGESTRMREAVGTLRH